jgi:hypothetical protein
MSDIRCTPSLLLNIPVLIPDCCRFCTHSRKETLSKPAVAAKQYEGMKLSAELAAAMGQKIDQAPYIDLNPIT